MLNRNGATMDTTMRSLVRDRLQTCLDGVVRGAECSHSVTSTNSLLRSRAGVLALICWLAAYSCSSSAPSTRTSNTRYPQRSSSSNLSDTSRHILGLAACTARFDSIATVPRKAAVLRSVHTSARHRTAHHLPISHLPQSTLTSSSRNDAQSTSARASLSSLTHPQPWSNSWLDRLSSTLASLLRASEQQSEHRSSQSDAPPHSRQSRTRGAGRIHSLMQDPQIYDPIVLPRYPIVLCHGLYGFDVRGPFLGLEIHYWAKTLDILRKKMGVDVLVHGVPPTGSIQERAESLHKFLTSDEAGVRGKKLNFVAHSMGGLDVRHLLTHIRPKPDEYIPVSLTTISTPHRGSPFMDWCNANIGIGNDYIEQAILEARAERANSTERDIFGPSRTTKVPYSLKSPIFTRPKPLDGSSSLPKKNVRSDKADELRRSDASNNESATETLFSAASSVVDALTSQNGGKSSKDSAAEKVKEAVKHGKDNGSLPFGLSSFIGSLSTLTGSFSSYMLSLLDTPAYAMLSTKYMNEVFNPKTPNVEGVKYYSVASRTPSLAIWHPLWLPKLILDAAAESRTAGGEIDGSADALGGADQGNDGLVSVESAKWGEFLGVMEGCDHWDLRGGGAPRWRQNINPSTGRPYPTKVAQESVASKQVAEPDDNSSWTDINRLLFSRSNDQGQAETADGLASGSSATDQPVSAFKSLQQLAGSHGRNGVSLRDPDAVDDVEPKPSDDGDGEDNAALSSFDPQHQDDTLVHEIASWISDRLPSGNAERRAIAQKRDRLIEQTGLTLYSPQKDADKSGGERDAGLANANPAPLGSLSQAAPFSTHQVAAPPHPAGETHSKANPKDVSDLEQFWIALCRHLHSEGL